MQIRTVLTWTAEEEQKISDAYIVYLQNGGRLSKNKWIKEMVMEKIR